MPDIRFDDVTKEFDEAQGLFHVSFQVEEGQAFAVLGTQGAGKSTIASLLMGLILSDEGKCEVRGFDCFLHRKDVHKLVGFTPALAAFPPEVNGEYYMRMLSERHGGISEKRVQSLMEKLDINPMGPFGRMTMENRRKMALLFGLMYDSPILVLDEPYASLQVFARNALTDLLEEEKRSGKTILILTHVLQQAQRLCDRMAILRKGRVVVEQSAQQMQFSRQKVYHVTFETPEEAARFSQEWEKGVELVGARAIIAIPGSPQMLIKTLARYDVKDLVGGRDQSEESFLYDWGNEML